MAFTVSDVGEVVRWTFGFGADARIVYPPRQWSTGKLAEQMCAEHER